MGYVRRGKFEDDDNSDSDEEELAGATPVLDLNELENLIPQLRGDRKRKEASVALRRRKDRTCAVFGALIFVGVLLISWSLLSQGLQQRLPRLTRQRGGRASRRGRKRLVL